MRCDIVNIYFGHVLLLMFIIVNLQMNSLGSLTILLDNIALDKLQRWYQLRVTRQNNSIKKIFKKLKNYSEKINKSSFANPRKRLSTKFSLYLFLLVTIFWRNIPLLTLNRYFSRIYFFEFVFELFLLGPFIFTVVKFKKRPSITLGVSYNIMFSETS